MKKLLILLVVLLATIPVNAQLQISAFTEVYMSTYAYKLDVIVGGLKPGNDLRKINKALGDSIWQQPGIYYALPALKMQQKLYGTGSAIRKLDSIAFANGYSPPDRLFGKAWLCYTDADVVARDSLRNQLLATAPEYPGVAFLDFNLMLHKSIWQRLDDKNEQTDSLLLQRIKAAVTDKSLTHELRVYFKVAEIALQLYKKHITQHKAASLICNS